MSLQVHFQLPVPAYGQEAVTPPESTHAIAGFAEALVAAAGPVLDCYHSAYRYGDAFVFRLHVTGKRDQVVVDVSQSAEPLAHQDFSIIVTDAVDALTALQLLRTALKRTSFRMRLAEQAGDAGTSRVQAVGAVVEWHEAQISHYRGERARMQAWSDANDGAHPGAAFDEYEHRIADHQHMIDRIVDFAV